MSPRAGPLELGELRAVIYRAPARPGRGRATYIHFFDRPPKLWSDATRRRLHILGGRYRITRRGIEG